MKECPTGTQTDMDTLCINTLRTLSIDAIEKAKSGHPGAPMGMAPAAYVLWKKHLRHNPQNPDWYDRDRFILSAGHASMLLYSLLYLFGYDLSLDDIKEFRQWKSITPGHPEYRITPGVETTTGPLGQGLANAVGMAVAERHLESLFNRPENDIVDHYTYVMCGDGDLMEGISYEAASLAGHLGLGKLICLYDDNDISIEGSTDITFTESVPDRFKAYNWHVIEDVNGHDINEMRKALMKAKAEPTKPTLIAAKTHIAYGAPNKQDSAEAHGAPLGEEDIKGLKEFFGLPTDKEFYVSDNVKDYFAERKEILEERKEAWDYKFAEWKEKYPKLYKEWKKAYNLEVKEDLEDI